MSINEFNEEYLLPLLEKINNLNKKCFVMGDFDIDLLKKSSKVVISQFFDNTISHYFSPYILQPSRITENSKSLIDNIFFNSLEYSLISGNLGVEISDHLIQFMILKDFKKKNV